ncbi:MAG: rod shape-determining protein MreD [Rudaea sp.]
MSPYLLVPFFALVALAQATLVPLLAPSNQPDLLLILVVAWGTIRGGGEATLWGLGGGLLLDLLSGVPFGLQAAGLGAVGLLADLMETNFFRSNILLPPAAIFVATILYHIIEAAAMQTLGHPIVWQTYLVSTVLPVAVLNTIIMPFVYAAMRRLYLREHPRLTW